MADLTGTRTHEHLLEAFARDSQTNRRFLWFAQQADIEGYPELAAIFRSVADGETGHALGHLEFLAELGDPLNGHPVGDTEKNALAAIASEAHECEVMYPLFAQTARDEGFDEIAEWFTTLARAERSHVDRLRQGLDAL